MRRADRITVATLGPDLFQQPVEVMTMFDNFGFIKNADRADEAVAIKGFDLLAGKHADGFGLTRMEIQIACQAIKLICFWNGFKLHYFKLLLSYSEVSGCYLLAPCGVAL